MRLYLVLLICLCAGGSGQGIASVGAANTVPQSEASGLACQLVVHQPVKTDAPSGANQKTYLEIPVELILKNVSTYPLRVTNFCMAWRGSSANSEEIMFNETFKSESPPYNEKYRTVVTVAPGETISVKDSCVPQNNQFHLTVGYSIGTECGQKLKVWHGVIAPPAVMVQVDPFNVWPAKQ